MLLEMFSELMGLHQVIMFINGTVIAGATWGVNFYRDIT